MSPIRSLFAGACLMVATAFAARVAPTDLGLSVWVPSGWALESLGGESDFRMYAMYDTSGAHGALVFFEVQSGIYAEGTTREWIKAEALTRGYMIEGGCFGSLFADDSMRVDGAFAREVYGQSADCDEGSSNLLSEMKDRYYRVTGYGNIGWVISFEGDTADVDTAANTYLDILDSVKLDLSFQSIPPVGVKYRHVAAAAARKIVSDGSGIRMDLGTDVAPQIQVLDLRGRVLHGSIVSNGGGVWSWRPERFSGGTVAIRIKFGAREWTGSTVLSR